MSETGSARRRVVVVGAGFAGLAATHAMAGAPVEITLIDQHNYHLFRPLLYQVATSALTPAEIAAPIRGIVRDQRNVTVFMDEVIAVDKDARTVRTAGGRKIEYDALVLATGARHSYFGNDHWARHAPGLKTIDDAFHLRLQILSAFENAEMAEQQERAAFLTFLIVGGGPTGVELAGAIAELSRSIARDFRNIDSVSARIILVQDGPVILPTFDKALSLRAARDLTSLGVEVCLGARVTEIGDCLVSIGDEEIMAGTVIWAAGVQASPASQWLGLETGPYRHIPVGSDLTVQGHPEIYAIGDTAAFTPTAAARLLPGVAPVAKQMGMYVGRRIARLSRGADPDGPFRYSDAGSMATIGRNHAIAQIGRMRFTGFTGWLLWGLSHVYFLIGFRNRLVVMLNWGWSYATWQRGVRLITGSQE
jgi:NADH dehydrogenase